MRHLAVPLLVLGVALVALSPIGSTADCTYIRAYGPVDLFSPCTLAINDYIEVGSVVSGPAGHTCENETFNTVYSMTVTDGCGGSAVCTTKVEGNNLSGTYQVTNIVSGC